MIKRKKEIEIVDFSTIISLLSGDENKLMIFLFLLVNKKLTLKELSDTLGKGKTTVHHHIRKLEDAGIVIWEEEDESRRMLKTRYYSINFAYLQKRFNIIDNPE